MQWSKLKSLVRDRICPELRKRIDFHLTSYRNSHDGADKVWITIDGRRVAEFKHYDLERAESEAYSEGLTPSEVAKSLRDNGVFGPRDFGTSMREYLDLNAADALASSDPIVKAFAIVDRRVGRRSLAKLAVADSDHALVRTFFEIRMSGTVAEGDKS